LPQQQGAQVAVVVAQGEILDNDAPQGLIGGRATAELIRKAREDEDIKAVVLRIDSPGGSAFGSELIRREVELTRKAGKPVVASMGDLAASGGYWITMGADEVLADAGTITGSIGVFGVLPTFEKTLDKVGVGVGGASTSWLAAASSPLTPMDKRLAEMVQLSVGQIYQQFITLAAQARGSTPGRRSCPAQRRGQAGLHRARTAGAGALAVPVLWPCCRRCGAPPRPRSAAPARRSGAARGGRAGAARVRGRTRRSAAHLRVLLLCRRAVRRPGRHPESPELAGFCA